MALALGSMPSTMWPSSRKRFSPAQIRIGDERARVIDAAENPGRAGAQDQLLRLQRRADGRRHGVGVDIEQRPGFIRRQRAHHRHEAVVEEFAEHGGVDRVDVADETEVDQFAARR